MTMTSSRTFHCNPGHDSRIRPGNRKSWVSVKETGSDDTTELHSPNCDESLPLVSQPRTGKRKTLLSKRGSNKFVTAIKSLQCSPRVDASDYGRLEESEKKGGGGSSMCLSLNHRLGLSPRSRDTDSNHNQHPLGRGTFIATMVEPASRQHPAFVANFGNFASMQGELAVVEKGAVSKNLELEKVLAKLDSLNKNISPTNISNDLEIFTNDTEDASENNENVREIGKEKEENDNDIDDLRTISGLSQSKTQENICRKDPALTVSPSIITGSNETDGSKPSIQNEFSQFSNDSNDTPVTCNKSVILTPKNDHPHGSPKEDQGRRDDNNIFCKPPKEILHRSLSLGDALTPTEDSPCQPDVGNEAREATYDDTYKLGMTPSPIATIGVSGNSDDNISREPRSPTGYPPQQQIELLRLPFMDRSRPSDGSSAKENTVLGAKQIMEHRSVFGSSSSKTGTSSESANMSPIKEAEPNEEKKVLTTRDDASTVCSSVSSFVFSTDSGRDLGCRKALKERGMQPKLSRGVNSKPTLPTFFWKTHPRVIIKSYQFQQRNSNFRMTNAKFTHRDL